MVQLRLHFARFSPLCLITAFASPVVCDSIVIKVTVVGDYVDPSYKSDVLLYQSHLSVY